MIDFEIPSQLDTVLTFAKLSLDSDARNSQNPQLFVREEPHCPLNNDALAPIGAACPNAVQRLDRGAADGK